MAWDQESSILLPPDAPPAVAPLINAALDLFARLGYHGTTTRDIAKQAGVSNAALYVHFPSKSALLFHIIYRSGSALYEQLLALPPQADSVAALKAFVAMHVRFHAEHNTAARIGNYELRSLSRTHLRRVMAIRNGIEQLLSQIIHRGVQAGEFTLSDPGIATVAILSLGIDVSRWYSARGRLSPEQLAAEYSDLIVGMVCKGGLPNPATL